MIYNIVLISAVHATLLQSCPTLVTPWTAAHQAPLSMGFSRQEHWSGLSFPSPGGLPDPGIKTAPLTTPVRTIGFLTTSATWGAPVAAVQKSDSGFFGGSDGEEFACNEET